MKLCLINGSHREKSQSYRIADHISKMALVKTSFNQHVRIDLCSAQIPVWNEGVWEDHPSWNDWFTIAKEIKSSDAFVIVTPEWGGMVPPLLKNLLLLCSVNETGHKPALIVTVSASQGGFAPMTELRSFAYKNNHICFLPDHVILHNVEDLFHGAPDDTETHLQGRLDYGVQLLSQYSKALIGVRETGVINNKEFKYGMS